MGYSSGCLGSVQPGVIYVGPGDIVAGAFAWWGLRAYSNAAIGTNAIRLREDGGDTEQDFVTIAGGGLNLSAIVSFAGGANLFVVTLYDQTGNGRHLTQATAASQPLFTLGAIGALPAMDNTAAASKEMFTAAVTQVQPLTFSLVANKTNGARGNPVSAASAAVQVTPGFGGTNRMDISAGLLVNTTASDNFWHAHQLVFNGASSDINVDGVSNIVNAGTNGFAADPVNLFGASIIQYIGYIAELGFWGSALSGANMTAMNVNQRDYWGISSYVGPGDVVGGATAWWGLRAYSNANIGTNCVRLREDGGNTEQDFVTMLNGGLDLAAIAAFKGANNLFVVTLYDQSGSGNNLTQATAGLQFPFTLNGLGSLPIMQLSSDELVSINSIVGNQPATITAVANSDALSSQGSLFLGASTSHQLGSHASAVNQAFIYAGSSVSTAASDNTWHAIQGVINGASSDINVDGSSNVVNAGAGTFNGTVAIGGVGVGQPYAGGLVEIGYYQTAFSGGQSSAMSANQHTYWGF